MNKKNAFRRGFTLIELMIVIVILGILMGTILPRLTGAQARARDTARKADLTNISQALEVYYGDEGEYPATPSSPGNSNGPCLASDDTIVYPDLSEYMKGNRVPEAVSKSQVTLGCTGSYYYKPLIQGGVPRASYVLASDVETWQLANYLANTTTAGEFSSAAEANTYVNNMGEDKVTEENSIEQKTIYIVIP